jgi:hypothetical protein
MTIRTAPATVVPITERQLPARIVCAASAAVAVVPFALASFSGDTGAEITAGIVADATALQLAGILAVLASAGLVLAAVRVGEALGGPTGRVAAAAGTAVAVLFAAYYSVFGAAGVVASQMLEDPGAGLGESASLLLNVVEITRYAPGLVLVAAVFVARRRLPGAIWVPAAILAVATLTPFTSWIAALLIPLWLGLAAAFLGRREAGHEER